MNLHKIYPEAHDAWLHAMGIDVRWRHRSAHAEVDTGAGVRDVNVMGLDVPEPIAHARYWIIGAAPLDAAQTYVLAGMLWAINADARTVIYSVPTAKVQSNERSMVTALPAWPQLRTLDVNTEVVHALGAILDAHPNMHAVVLHDEANTTVTHERLIYLPSLRTLRADALQKQLAWAALKSLRIDANRQ